MTSLRIREANILYSTSEIEDRRQVYKAGETIKIRYDPKFDIATFSQDRLVGRFVCKYQDASDAKRMLLYNWDISSIFELQNAEINSVKFIPGTSRYRSLYNHIRSFLKRIETDHADWSYGDADYSQFKPLQDELFAGGVNENVFSSYLDYYDNSLMAYREQFAHQVQNGARQYKIGSGGPTGFASSLNTNPSTPADAQEYYTYFSIPLHKLVGELENIQALDMAKIDSVTFEFQLRLPRECMHIAAPPDALDTWTDFVFKDTDSYVLTDIQLERNIIKLAEDSRQIIQFPKSYFTYSHTSKRMTSSTDQVKLSVGGNVSGVIVCFTPDQDVSLNTTPLSVGPVYQSDLMLGTPMCMRHQDMYYLRTDLLQVQLGNVLFRQNMPIGAQARDRCTYIT